MRCQNCGEIIVLVNFALRKTWMHQPPGAAFSDGQYEYCRLAIATPEDLDDDSDHSAGSG